MIRRSLKRRILFTLSFLFDAYQEMSVRNFYRKLYSPLYQRSTITETLTRMAKVKELEKKVVKGKVVLRISAKGESILNEEINLLNLAKKSWDGVWRIVIFDIEEKESHTRNMLRRKLKSLGFAMWQESVYISPHPVAEEMNEFFAEKDLFPRCLCFEGKLNKAIDDKELAYFAFNLDHLTNSYIKLKKDAEKTITNIKNQTTKKIQAFELLRTYSERFEHILLDDPFLPKELYLESSEREKTQKILTLLAKNLAGT